MTAYIAYKNELAQNGATVTMSGVAAAADYPVAHAYDYKTHTLFKPATAGTVQIDLDAGFGNAVPGGTFAVANHNLADESSSILLQYSSDGSSYTTLFTITPPDKKIIFDRALITPNARYWRIQINSATTDLFIGQLFFGGAQQCRPIGDGFTPGVYQHMQTRHAVSRAGNFLGAVSRETPQRIKLRQQGITESLMRNNWVPLLEHVSRRPFFFCPQFEDYPDEALWCWCDKPPAPAYKGLCKMSIDFDFMAMAQ